ncbi:MAG: tRNA (adenosine(37)-N6)-dimethylallyltransferase MiaA [Acidimicrobiia bacterium]
MAGASGQAALPGAAPRLHLALVGATASGKSSVALAAARRFGDLELVSIDSMQVYRGMDIGTAKPSPAEQAEVPHHLIDLCGPEDEFTVTRFQTVFAATLAAIEGRGRRALLVGGTGLYLRAVIDGLVIPGRFPDVATALERETDTAALHARLSVLDPTAAARMEPTNRRRVLRALEVTVGSGRPFSTFGPGLEAYPESAFRLLGVALPTEVVAERITARFRRQMETGFLEEVQALAARPAGLSRTARQALGYRELLAHVEEGEPLDECVLTAVRRTRRFARRQRAWFRRDPRITWLTGSSGPSEVMSSLFDHLSRHTVPAGPARWPAR